MKEVADKYHSFFSPQPFAIAGFFAPQTVIQLLWLYRLVRLANSSSSSGAGKLAGAAAEQTDMAKYAGTFILGNAMIGLWMVFWNSERLDLSHACVTVNSLAQLYHVCFALSPMDSSNALTHVVAKMFAGIGVLDLLDNAASWLYPGYAAPPAAARTIVAALTAVGFPAGALVADGVMGLCLAYDAFALAAGQTRDANWQKVLLATGAVTALISAVKAYDARGLIRAVASAN